MIGRMVSSQKIEADLLRQAFLKVASSETSCHPKEYPNRAKEFPLYLHCGAVATTVQGIYGGDIVTGRINGITHYWNRLPDGKEVDFTSCQFGGDGFNPLKKGRRVSRKGRTNLRFLLFAQRVLEVIKS